MASSCGNCLFVYTIWLRFASSYKGYSTLRTVCYVPIAVTRNQNSIQEVSGQTAVIIKKKKPDRYLLTASHFMCVTFS